MGVVESFKPAFQLSVPRLFPPPQGGRGWGWATGPCNRLVVLASVTGAKRLSERSERPRKHMKGLLLMLLVIGHITHFLVLICEGLYFTTTKRSFPHAGSALQIPVVATNSSLRTLRGREAACI